MKERPMIFSAPMVKALLADTKSQTRRVVKPQPPAFDITPISCPYGGIGDRLWIKETWALAYSGTGGTAGAHYKADHLAWLNGEQAWKPSIFMPRWASRITLEISDVRVERVQDITDVDARAEGVMPQVGTHNHGTIWRTGVYQETYAELWDTLNGKKYPWSSNPFCWVLEFRRV